MVDIEFDEPVPGDCDRFPNAGFPTNRVGPIYAWDPKANIF